MAKRKQVIHMKYKAMYGLLFVMLLTFYALPIIIQNVVIGILVLWFINPIISFACSYVYGKHASFHILIPIIISMMFAISTLLFYNDSALVYAVFYGLFSLLGMFIGAYVRKRNTNS